MRAPAGFPAGIQCSEVILGFGVILLHAGQELFAERADPVVGKSLSAQRLTGFRITIPEPNQIFTQIPVPRLRPYFIELFSPSRFEPYRKK